MLVLAGAAVSAAPASAQPANVPAAVRERMLAREAQRQQARSAFLESRGRARHVRALEAALGAAPGIPVPTTEPALRASYLTEVAQDLAVLGFDAQGVASLRGRGVDVIAAAVAGSRASFAQKAALTGLVVIGEAVSVVPDPGPGDGYRSSATFRVVETLKGAPPGATVVVRQRTGPDTDSTVVVYPTDLSPEPGDRYLLFVSRELYEEGSVALGGRPAPEPQFVVVQRAPYKIEGDTLVAHGFTETEGNPGLARVRAEINDVAQKARGPR